MTVSIKCCLNRSITLTDLIIAHHGYQVIADYVVVASERGGFEFQFSIGTEPQLSEISKDDFLDFSVCAIMNFAYHLGKFFIRFFFGFARRYPFLTSFTITRIVKPEYDVLSLALLMDAACHFLYLLSIFLNFLSSFKQKSLRLARSFHLLFQKITVIALVLLVNELKTIMSR